MGLDGGGFDCIRFTIINMESIWSLKEGGKAINFSLKEANITKY